MISFIALGTTDLRTPDGSPIGALLTQPKRMGLLLYLCLEGRGGFVRRDRVLALFWPESSEDKARNSLRQALHQLRRALGDEVVVSRGAEEIGIAPEALWCDAAAFDTLAGEGKPGEALGLYRGELLAGLHLADAPGFSEWLDGERVRLQRRAIDLAGALAERAQAEGDPGAALAWARRGVALAPLEEEPVRRLITLLEQAGDRGGALAEFEQLTLRLRRELDVSPSAESRQLVAELRARPDPRPRLTPLPVPTLPGETGGSAQARSQASGSPSRVRSWRRMGLLAAVGALLLVGIGAVWPFLRRERAGMPPEPRRVLVAPFRVSGADPALAYLREGMLDLLAAKLGSGSTLVAAEPRTALVAWRQLAGDSAADLPPEDATRVARRLGAGRLLLGSVVGTERRLILSARLLGVADGEPRAAAEVSGPLDSLPQLIDQLTAALLIGEAGGNAEGFAELASASLPALRVWLAGREAHRRGDYRAALDRFTEATDLDSTFALAWLWRADAADWVADRSQGRVNLEALRYRDRLAPRDQAFLDAVVGPPGGTAADYLALWERVVVVAPDRAEGWLGLGNTLFHHGQRLGADSNFVRAEAAFRRAQALDSGYAAPLSHLVRIALAHGDLAEAREHFRRYARLDSAGAADGPLRWRIAIAAGDSAEVAAYRARFPRLPQGTLVEIASMSLLDGVGVGDGQRAVQVLFETASSTEERLYARSVQMATTLATGHLREYQDAVAEAARLSHTRPLDLFMAHAAMFGDGDSAAAEAWFATARRTRDPPAHPDASLAEHLWRVWHGAPPDSAGLARVLAALDTNLVPPGWIEVTRLEHEALWRCERGDTAAMGPVRRLEGERLRRGVEMMSDVQFVLARCYERLGNPEGALRIMRQRSYEFWRGTSNLARALREEGRLALLTRDTVGARRAWRHYIALRADADSGVQGYVREVRAALGRLGK